LPAFVVIVEIRRCPRMRLAAVSAVGPEAAYHLLAPQRPAAVHCDRLVNALFGILCIK
jgi:hypothetical protein